MARTSAFVPSLSNPFFALTRIPYLKPLISDQTLPTSRVLQQSKSCVSADIFDTGKIEVQLFPATQSLFTHTNTSSINNEKIFSILSWNILLPNSKDNWWNQKMYAPWVPMEKRRWSHRQALIREKLLLSGADIVCIQEADGDTFEEDFSFMNHAGYSHCLHKKFLYRCATFFKEDKFILEEEGHKDRTLVTTLRSVKDDSHLLNVVNCHLSGGASPERRLRQVYESLDQIRKWNNKVALNLQKQLKANRPSPRNILKAEESVRLHDNAGVIVCGDFNSDGNTGVRRLLVEGSVDSEWREPQYPDIPLTSKRKENSLGRPFSDAVEQAYASNVCDGDYGEDTTFGCRPATYIVPNLASLLLSPIVGEKIPRTQFGMQVARGLADTLGLRAFCENEIDRAFDSIDLDGNNVVDEEEIHKLLESAYVATFGRQIEEEKKKFFNGFQGSQGDKSQLTREQLTEKLLVLQLELEGKNDRCDFDQQVAKGLAKILGLHTFCENEISQAFKMIDLDGNSFIDEEEIQKLLESVYVAKYGQQIEFERRAFFNGFKTPTTSHTVLSRKQVTEKLIALQQELEGGKEGSELVEIRTEADAQRMIDRFSPLLQRALDHVFDKFSSDNGETLTEVEISKFLIKTNGQLGRGGTSLQAATLFKTKANDSKPMVLTRQEWYGIFARELGQGKWWQVVYDLEVCGASIRSLSKTEGQHYQGWLDYIYFDTHHLKCIGVQEALTATDLSRIMNDGDSLPNEWHPSDHLPVAALFALQ